MNEAGKAAQYESATLARPWFIAIGVIAVLAVTAICMVGVYLFYLPAARHGPIIVSRFVEPRLQVDPQEDLRKLEAKEKARLAAIRWRDRDSGTLTIPIEAAMAVVAARGNDAYAPLPNAPEPRRASGGRPPAAHPPSDRPFNPGAGAPGTVETSP